MEKSPRAGPDGPEKGNLILSPAEDAGDMISFGWKDLLKQTAKPSHRSFPPGHFGHSPPFVGAERHPLSPHPTKRGGGGGTPAPARFATPAGSNSQPGYRRRSGKKNPKKVSLSGNCLPTLDTLLLLREGVECYQHPTPPPPPGKVGGKALGANPRLSTRASETQKGQ